MPGREPTLEEGLVQALIAASEVLPSKRDFTPDSAHLYVRALADLDPRSVLKAVGWHVQNGRYMPTPAEIRQRVREQRRLDGTTVRAIEVRAPDRSVGYHVCTVARRRVEGGVEFVCSVCGHQVRYVEVVPPRIPQAQREVSLAQLFAECDRRFGPPDERPALQDQTKEAGIAASGDGDGRPEARKASRAIPSNTAGDANPPASTHQRPDAEASEPLPDPDPAAATRPPDEGADVIGGIDPAPATKHVSGVGVEAGRPRRGNAAGTALGASPTGDATSGIVGSNPASAASYRDAADAFVREHRRTA